MNRLFRSALPALLLLTMAPVLAAQSKREKDKERDKEIDRTADRISKTVERTVDQAMRTVDRTLRDVQDRFGYDERQSGDRIDTTFRFLSNGIVDLTSTSGDIVVTGWNRDEVRVRASTERGRLHWDVSSSRVTIETESLRGHTGDTRYELSVPQGARVVMHSSSGDLTVKGTRGAVDLTSTGGDVHVEDASGRIELGTINGDVIASNLDGEVRATSVSGAIELTNVDARVVHVESTSGDLVLHGVKSRDVSASTVNGEIEYQGTIDGNGQYEFHSHSGDVTLDLPSTPSARFSVETFSGELDAGGFPVTIQPRGLNRQEHSRRIEFTLGGGDARVIVETFSGDIQFRRGARRERGESNQ